MNKRLSILFIPLLFLQIALFAQPIEKEFYRVIPQNEQTRRSFNITKTPDGFIWYVTEDGVSRYDGKYVKNYPVKIGWRGFLEVNSKGDLYLCNTTGVGYKYNESKDRFEESFRVTVSRGASSVDGKEKKESVDIPTAFKVAVPPNISSMAIDGFDQIWIGTGEGPVCFNPKSKKWSYIRSNELKNGFLFVQKNRIYIFMANSIYYTNLTSDGQRKNSIFKIKNSAINSDITAVTFESNTGNIYIGTATKGLFCLTKNGKLTQSIALSNSVIRAVKMYDQNTLLVGFDGLGIYEYDIYGQKIVNHYIVDENKTGSIGSNAIYDILVDNDKRIWVANYTTGVEIYDPNMVRFSLYNHILKDDNSLAHNNVLAIVEDKFKNLWFGTFNGLSVKKKANGSWSHFLINNLSTQTNSYINTLCTDSYGDVWAGGVFGLRSFNPSNFGSKSIGFTNKFSRYDYKNINGLLSDNQTVWAVGLHTDLIEYNSVNNTIKNYHSDLTRCIEYEDENHLLLLGDEKIASFNKLNGVFDYTIDSNIKKALKTQNPEYLSLRQKNDNIWIASKLLGVIQYSKSTNSVFVYNREMGISSNRILSIEIDNNDCVWIATDEGLCYLNPVTKIVIPFKIFPGSEKGLFNINASKKLNDGTIIFGTKEGAISFDPRKMFFSPNRGKLALTDFMLLNKNEDSRKFDEISEVPLNKCDEIVLKSYENSFSVKFEELIYGHTILPRYKYRLKGYESDFSLASSEGSASFYGLPPGDYTLEIQSFYVDNEGKFIERFVDIIVLQPWYYTYWAWILWLLLLAAILIAVYRYSKHRLDIRYSNEKISFFTNVSHDMRTPITLIKAPLGDLLLDESLSPTARYLVQMINNNTNRLFDMINRVLDFEKADEREMKLSLEIIDLNKYVTEVVENFTSYAEINALKINAVLNQDSLMVYLDKEKMDMIIENLISNSIKYSIPGGLVNVIAGNDDTKWWIEVKDNGIGIPITEQKKIFNRFYRAENAINSKKIGSGMGLLLVNNLAQYMGGTVSFESEEGIKTTFKVSFPFSEASRKINGNLSTTAYLSGKIIDLVPGENATPVLLFVDDNDEIRSYINARLSSDFVVFTAESAAQAWSILQSEKVDVIITDIMMPEVSGLELCEKIKSNDSYSHIPVVLLSALSDKNDIIKGLKIGADDYITKPFDSNELKQRVKNILANRIRLANYLVTHNTVSLELDKQSFVSEMDKLFVEKLEHTFNLNMANSEYTIDSLSRDIGMSRSVFFNRLKNLTNLSPNDYLRKRRLEYAAELLVGKELSLDEVSQMVGYKDVRHFKVLFKKKFGCQPSEYRINSPI
jgi:signal transduction histidine kinase/DNA-binding response OmpR family regulator/ligand-binding sensor domain-containing protein